ncbi:5-oxoprolinase subunit PxpB [Pontibacillus sp. HMF3514]|uniref:5-oxoprolinase subunit PxpB n=1 Tax=Pontibacillus sp. HMF3514 TaxID=2692425 RepID=UPI00131FD352|nr:5-oxoprolinase subunit PxpB [Pontibacillus sp. HMF3514]QHE53626.1 5-oxoprolinase subunit PxpB [Pontibacillus sp. HMF3514]
MGNELNIHPLGDSALTIKLDDNISPEVNQKVLALAKSVEQKGSRSIIEIVPAYTTIAVYFDPFVTSYDYLSKSIHKSWQDLEIGEESISRDEVIIPVLYGGERGPDLGTVAQHNGLTPEDVIKRHTTNDYLVYMIGFLPGFPYLGGLDKELATPRLDTPRQEVKAGSVGIADQQTGVYSLDSPGGWNIIGHTPVKFFDPEREEPFLLRAGQSIRFKEVDENEWHSIQDSVKRGTYEIEVRRGGSKE